MTVVECIIADTTGASKLSCYNKTAFPMLQTGPSVMILNLISKQREIVVTSEGKILMIPDLEIPEEHDTAAKALIPQLTNPTGAAEKTILEIHELPTGTLVSCTAKVVEVEELQTVQTTYAGETDVRNGVIGDHTASICFAFWRKLAHQDLHLNDCIKISGGVVAKTTDGMPKVSGNQRTTVQLLPPDTVPVVKGSQRYEEEGDIIAISNLQIYSSCKKSGCFRKKLINNNCPKCNTDYANDEEQLSVICNIGIDQETNFTTATLFTPQVKELMKDNEEFKITRNPNLEQDILLALPLKVGFTRSPMKDNNTLSIFKRL